MLSVGHVRLARLQQDGAETGVGVGIAATGARGDGDFLADRAENLAALGIGRALGALDCSPLAMT
jgi:hypothetical protein